jgi:hypothetical protein
MKTLKVAYIDNSIENEGIGSALELRPKETGGRLSSEFVLYEGKPEQLLKTLRGINPDLILLDHFLSTKPQSDGLTKFGSSFVEVFKEKFPLAPIVGVTGALDKGRTVEAGQVQVYDDLFRNSSLSDNAKQIASLGFEFKKVRSHPIRSIRQLIEKMNAPDEDVERLEKVLMTSLDDLEPTEQLSHSSVRFSRQGFMWIYKNLMKEPGLLLDSQWAGAIFGLTTRAFLKFQKKFSKAKYSGPFSSGFGTRWWRSKLIEIGVQLSKGKNFSDLGRLGAEFPGVRQADLAICQVCKKVNTQTLGLNDDSTRAVFVNLHLIHSIILRESKLSFFEPRRARTRE